MSDHAVNQRAETAVMRAFFRDGRLAAIPARRKKRRIVLEHIVRVFEVGIVYSESEVNIILRAFHDDHAALRRYLVDEEFLTRRDGNYWRTGGWVEV